MWGWIVAIVTVVIILAVGGGVTNGMGGSTFLPGGCAGCKVLASWWHSLNFFQHIWYSAFYFWKLVYCATSDC
jgi:hypothetical protein